jgi:MFS family permease
MAPSRSDHARESARPRDEQARATVRRILGTTVIYRTATGMGPLAILTIVSAKQSLATASLALTCWTLAGAVAQPLWVGLATRHGRGRVLLALGALTAVCHVAIGLVAPSVWVVYVAALAGLFLPPVTAHARGLIAELLDGAQRERAFAVESALAGLGFVIGPLIVGACRAVATAGPAVAIAALLWIASVYFAFVGRHIAADDETHSHQHQPSNPSGARDAASSAPVRRRSYRRAWILIVAGAACYGMLACIEVAVVARFPHAGASAWTLACWSLASMIGGMIVARMPGSTLTRLTILLVPPAAYFALACVGTEHPGVFVTLLVGSGFVVAPALGLISTSLSRVVAPSARARAFAWLQTGSWIGASLATSLAGALATRHAASPLLIAGLFAAVVALGVGRSLRWNSPD